MKLSKEVSSKTLNQMLKEIGYNDSPLRNEIINTFKEWLQQKLYPDPKKYEMEYTHNFTINELLEELERVKQT